MHLQAAPDPITRVNRFREAIAVFQCVCVCMHAPASKQHINENWLLKQNLYYGILAF